MKRYMPLEITISASELGEVIQKGPPGKGLKRISARVTHVPMMLQGKINAPTVRKLANRIMANSHGFDIGLGDAFHRRPAHVVPKPVRINFVANDEVDS